MRAEDAQGTPTQSHMLSSILVYEDNGQDINKLLQGVARSRWSGAGLIT